MRRVTDAERRARIARRHALAPEFKVGDAEAAVRAMTVLHATEAPSVYLSLFARVGSLKVSDVDAALYEDRTLVKQLAMRRTLFVFPRDLLPAALGSASARVARQNGARLAKEVEAAGLAKNGIAWLQAARSAVASLLAAGAELSAKELREQVPELAGRIQMAPDKKWGGEFSIGPRVLAQLGAEGVIARGRNQAHWRLSRPRWTSMESWLGEVPRPLSEREGYEQLVRQWLQTFGPGTIEDIRWWLGSTVSAVKQALSDVSAVEVTLDSGATGWLLPDDDELVSHEADWGALLPVLDPTVMGWKSREFYLGRHGSELFDTSGNAGTTTWWNGRIVGCWIQDQSGEVQLVFLENPGAKARRILQLEAERLTDWLEGDRVFTVYSSPAMREAGSRLGI
ncbi:MAG TPA: winged helix DNA-binding domain-containing protein [Acidimicrobiia bacterium]|nr:winged helix DNA-binding domain-containing protein [Acidimicrobiia bacterium]